MSEDLPSPESPAAKGNPFGNRLVLGSAVLVLVGSFLNFYELDLYAGSDEDEFGAGFFGMFFDTTWTAWADAWSLFPLVAVSVVAAAGLGVVAALREFSSAQVPMSTRLGSARGLSIMVAAFAFVSVAAFVIRPFTFDPGEDEAPLEIGAGGWIVLAGMLGLIVGTILMASDANDGGGGTSPDRPTGASESDTQQLTWSMIGLAGFVVCWIGSFLPVLGAGGSFGDSSESADSFNAWEGFMRPVFGLPAILATVVVALSLAKRANQSLGLERLDLSIRHLQIGASIYAAVVAVSLLVGNPFFGNLDGLTESKVGHYLMVLGALALCAASILQYRDPKPIPRDIAVSAD